MWTNNVCTTSNGHLRLDFRFNSWECVDGSIPLVLSRTNITFENWCWFLLNCLIRLCSSSFEVLLGQTMFMQTFGVGLWSCILVLSSNWLSISNNCSRSSNCSNWAVKRLFGMTNILLLCSVIRTTNRIRRWYWGSLAIRKGRKRDILTPPLKQSVGYSLSGSWGWKANLYCCGNRRLLVQVSNQVAKPWYSYLVDAISWVVE